MSGTKRWAGSLALLAAVEPAASGRLSGKSRLKN